IERLLRPEDGLEIGADVGMLDAPDARVRPLPIFVSHAWRYDPDYQGLVAALGTFASFPNRIVSSPQRSPSVDPNSPRGFAALREALDIQIRQASCVLILARMFVAEIAWIQAEITLALRYGKPVLGITSAERGEVPRGLTSVCNEVVGGNPDAIVAAIRRY